jgi:2-octaprenylphenol hydroxylase
LFTYDILIIGSGIVGATTALALAKKTTLRIALLDVKKISAEWQFEKKDLRVSAISLASQRIFHQLNVWPAVQAKRVSPYEKMHVWDANSLGQVEFDCRAIQQITLGYIVEDSVLRTSILEQCFQCQNLTMISPVQLHSLHETPDYAEIHADDNRVFQAKMIIGADGGQSWLRTQADIEFVSRDYAHRAIVTTVKTELPHQATARQCFLTTGPLAFLPLTDPHTSSIVWSTSPEDATCLLALSNEDFQQKLAQAFDNKLGNVFAKEPRLSFDLHMRHVKNYVKPRLALVGDAAHTIHPMAGQGVNLGLLDAAALVDVIVDAQQKKRDFASLSVLRRYERWRKSDNAIMLSFVEGIKCLFASESKSVRQLRQLGMATSNSLTWIKKFFTNYAAGNRPDMPTLTHIHCEIE